LKKRKIKQNFKHPKYNTSVRFRGTRETKAVLIVCEGKKTEKKYFTDFKIYKKLSATIKICGSERCGSNPVSIVDFTLKEAENFEYDEVWVVFDMDQHKNISEAINYAFTNKIKIAFSNPCFEIWYLLHFRYSLAFIDRNETEKELKNKYLAGYDKSFSYYKQTLKYQGEAIKNAKLLEKHHIDNNNKPVYKGKENILFDNPSTTVYKLVEMLNMMPTRY